MSSYNMSRNDYKIKWIQGILENSASYKDK